VRVGSGHRRVSFPLPARLARDLKDVVGRDHLLTEADVRRSYEQDWTGRFQGRTPAVLRPGSTEEVAACLALCNDAGAAVVAQGGNTGLVGGGVPLGDEVVMSLARLRRLDPVDVVAAQVTAGAGVTLGAVQRQAADAGLAYAVDLAARDTATIGGTIATNAGGVHVLRHGATRAQLLGIEAVLASGEVISHLGGLVKDNTGYDLTGLLCGSEGTLAVVTAARLRLVPSLRHRVTVLVGMTDLVTAVAAVARWRVEVPELEAAEVFFDAGLSLVCDAFGWAPPLPERWPVYVLIEAGGQDDPTAHLADLIGSDATIGDVAVASDTERRAALWRYRDEHPAAVNQLGPPHKFDVTLALGSLAAFTDEVTARISAAYPAARTWMWGHIGDGNLHVNVTGLAPDDDRIDDVVLTLVADHGGSISAEHGIGTAKRRWLHLNRSPSEIATFAAIKRALDPNAILNPNVLLP
jgi:FAD/FMN-containing dehydrogenase